MSFIEGIMLKNELTWLSQKTTSSSILPENTVGSLGFIWNTAPNGDCSSYNWLFLVWNAGGGYGGMFWYCTLHWRFGITSSFNLWSKVIVGSTFILGTGIVVWKFVSLKATGAWEGAWCKNTELMNIVSCMSSMGSWPNASSLSTMMSVASIN